MDYFTFQNWFLSGVPPATPSLPQAPLPEAFGQQQQKSPHYSNLAPSQTPSNDGVLSADHILDHFAEGDDDDPFVVITEQDTHERHGTDAAEGLTS